MPLKNWGEFKGIGPKKQSFGNVAQASSRNPNAIDCFGSGILLPTIFYYSSIGFRSNDLRGDFGHRGPIEFAFRVYFVILLMLFGLSFLGLIFFKSHGVAGYVA